MGTFSQNLQLNEPTPGDPNVKDAWGTILNTDFSLIDSAVAGVLTLDLSASTNVILSSIAGQPDQARNARFVFTGALLANVTVFWPLGLSRVFSVTNHTTGNFTLTLAVNNGAGAPEGATTSILAGNTLQLASDGTNIISNGVAAVFPPGTAMVFRQSAAPPGWTQDTTINDSVLRLVSGAGGGTGGSWVISGLTDTITVAGTALSLAQLAAHAHNINILSSAENAPHNHQVAAGTPSGVSYVASGGGGPQQSIAAGGTTITSGTESSNHQHAVNGATDVQGAGAAHTHGATSALVSDGTWRPAYADVIVCKQN